LVAPTICYHLINGCLTAVPLGGSDRLPAAWASAPMADRLVGNQSS
jgi:hypothetical protein